MTSAQLCRVMILSTRSPVRRISVLELSLFHRRTRTVYGCLAWYNVLITSCVHSSLKSQFPKVWQPADSCDGGISVLNHCLSRSNFVNTHLPHSRQWFNIHVFTEIIYHSRCHVQIHRANKHQVIALTGWTDSEFLTISAYGLCAKMRCLSKTYHHNVLFCFEKKQSRRISIWRARLCDKQSFDDVHRVKNIWASCSRINSLLTIACSTSHPRQPSIASPCLRRSRPENDPDHIGCSHIDQSTYVAWMTTAWM